jgi:hypothetical protein
MSKTMSLTGLVCTFLAAYACDRWVESLRAEAFNTFNATGTFLWLAGVANILLAIALLLLAWHVLFRSDKSILISAVFMLVGLGVSFACAIEVSIASTLPPLGIVEFLTPNSHVLYVAAFAVVVGSAGLVLPRRLKV